MRGLRLNAARAVALLGVAFATAASAQTVTVVEYYNKTLDAYFITGRVSEQSVLDGIADFQRTGMTFQASATASATSAQTKICRFYISASSPFTSSHFYGRQGIDCESIRNQNLPGFAWEDFDFATLQSGGASCPSGTTTIYRGFRAAAGGKTPNHRYSASQATYDAAVATGYVGEGVAFCVTAATAATAAPTPSGDACGTFYFPGKQISVGSYIRDYRAMRANPLDKIELQYETMLRLWQQGRIDGYNVLSACELDIATAECEWIRDFIAAH